MAEGKILLILVIALLVLGPEKLPKLAADVGRWIGRARGMARQLQSQLDQEVHLNSILREQPRTTPVPPMPPAPATPADPAAAPAAGEPATSVDPYHSHAHGPDESHPDYAAGREAAAAALAQAAPAPLSPTTTESPQDAPPGNVRPLV